MITLHQESLDQDSRRTNELRIPGDRKPRKKFLLWLSGYFRLLRNFLMNFFGHSNLIHMSTSKYRNPIILKRQSDVLTFLSMRYIL